MDTTWTYLFTKGSQTIRIFLNKKFELFIKENQLDAAWSKLANLQEATNLSELNAVEAKKEVEVAKFNIDFFKGRGHVEEIFWRFPQHMTDYLTNT